MLFGAYLHVNARWNSWNWNVFLNGKLMKTRTTRTPAFLDTHRHPMITHTSDSHQIPIQNKTKSKLQILKKMPKNQILKFCKRGLHATHLLHPTRTVGATGRTRDMGRTKWNQYISHISMPATPIQFTNICNRNARVTIDVNEVYTLYVAKCLNENECIHLCVTSFIGFHVMHVIEIHSQGSHGAASTHWPQRVI